MSEYNIQMNKYNALNAEYDQLYPATKIENVDGLNTALQKKADLGEDGKVPAEQVNAYSQSDSISASTRTALSLPETATPDAALAEIARQLSESGGVKLTKLWENASPTSTFAAQTINVSADYETYLIDFKNHDGFFNSQKCDKNVLCCLVSANTAIDGYGMHGRKVTISDSGSVSFQSAYGTDKTNCYANDYLCIPYRIYGVKGLA